MKRTAKILSMLMAVLMLFAATMTGLVSAEELAVSESGEGTETVEAEEAMLDGSSSDIVVAVSRSGLEVTVSWTGGTPNYEITVKDDTDGTTSIYEATASPLSQPVAVKHGHQYTFTVKDSAGKTGSQSLSVPGEGKVPQNVQVYPDYKSVTIVWDEVDGATKYKITRSDGQTVTKAANKFPKASEEYGNRFGANALCYRDNTYNDKHLKKDKQYSKFSFNVRAIFADGSESEPSKETKKEGKVQTALYKCTFKAGVTLKSHDKKKKAVNFKKGQTVTADGFGQGSYHFSYKNRPYEAKWFRMSKTKGVIKKNAYCNNFTAEAYVNHAHCTSKTKYLIWVNLYSQRVYIFKGKKHNWKLINKGDDGTVGKDGLEGYLCGSGKAKFPTPTGTTKKLHTKKKSYSKHKWWNMFSGTNAIHGSNGKSEEDKLGALISNGCVRVTNDQAKWIFNNVPLKTTVAVF
jgi:lipoprotein-anchoring transpeptidase ErfK/SrfK